MRIDPVAEPAFSLPAAPVPVRQVIGDYEIVGKLGQGGMGAVYQARQESRRRFVALRSKDRALEKKRETSVDNPEVSHDAPRPFFQGENRL
jgi:serine/threonine protein kinase